MLPNTSLLFSSYRTSPPSCLSKTSNSIYAQLTSLGPAQPSLELKNDSCSKFPVSVVLFILIIALIYRIRKLRVSFNSSFSRIRHNQSLPTCSFWLLHTCCTGPLFSVLAATVLVEARVNICCKYCESILTGFPVSVFPLSDLSCQSPQPQTHYCILHVPQAPRF